MSEVSTIGLDLAKHVFQVHGVDEQGNVVLRKQLRRVAVVKFFADLTPCTVGIEAADRALLGRGDHVLGHIQIRLMPPGPAWGARMWKRADPDAADLKEAICEAGDAASESRFVAGEVRERQRPTLAVIYKVRELLVRQRTQLINALRSHLAEMGIVAAKGVGKLDDLVAIVRDPNDNRLPPPARLALEELAGQIAALEARIDPLQERISSQVGSSEAGRRLMSIPGVGPIVAGAMLAMVPDPGGFRSARHLRNLGSALHLDRTPAAASSGYRSISKQGNRYLRSLLILGAANVLRRRKKNLSQSGLRPCAGVGRSKSWPWRSRTRWPASSGR